MPASQGAPASPVCALPGIGFSRAPPGIQGFRREDRSHSPQYQVWHSRPPSSSAVLTALTHPRLLCPPSVPCVEGAVPSNAAGAPSSGQLSNSERSPRVCRTPMVPLLTSCLPAPFLAPLSTPAPSQPFFHPSSSHFHYLAHYRPSLHRLSGGAVPRVVAEGARVARFLGVGSFGNSPPSGICILRGRDRAPRKLPPGTAYEPPIPDCRPPTHSSLPKV